MSLINPDNGDETILSPHAVFQKRKWVLDSLYLRVGTADKTSRLRVSPSSAALNRRRANPRRRNRTTGSTRADLRYRSAGNSSRLARFCLRFGALQRDLSLERFSAYNRMRDRREVHTSWRKIAAYIEEYDRAQILEPFTGIGGTLSLPSTKLSTSKTEQLQS